MTKKDYELIAAALKRAHDACAHYSEAAAVAYVAATLAGALETDNPRFDCARFLRACGIED